MKAITKILAVLLCALMLLGALAACGKADDPAADSGSGNQGETPNSPDVSDSVSDTEKRDDNGYIMDDLPELTYNNADFRVLTWQNMKSWEWCTELTKDSGTVDRALYNRIQTLQERFGVKFVINAETPGAWDDMEKFNTVVRTTVQVGTQEFDLIGSYTHCAGTLALENSFVDLYQTDYVNFDKPWWPASIVETASIGDKVYFATGDITPTLIRNVHCMYVNEDMYETLQMGQNYANGRSMYDVVKEGDWTIELMEQMVIGTVTGADQYALEFENDVQADAFFYGSGFMLVENANGILTLSDDLVGINVDTLYKKLQTLFVGTSAGIDTDKGKNNASFYNNKALFNSSSVANAQRYANKDDNTFEFSILPMPKFNTDQESYATVASFWVTMYGIPTDAPNMEMSSVILEGLASEAHRSVKDVIYYDVFASRFMSDAKKAELLDIVSKSIVFDPARMYGVKLNNFATFRNGVNSTDSWQNVYSSANNNGAWNTKIEEIYALLG